MDNKVQKTASDLNKSGIALDSGLALQNMNKGIKPVRKTQNNKRPYLLTVERFGHWQYVAKILPDKSATLKTKTTATGVKKFLVHVLLVTDSTVDVNAGKIISVVA